MDIFFKKLLSERDKLSDLEKQVLAYMMEKPEMVTTNTLEELSKELFVSTATISRTCKKLGFDGFQGLKFSLIQYKEEYAPQDKPNEVQEMTDHLDRFKREMQENLDKLKCLPLDEVLSLLNQSNHVEIFGVGSSLPLCLEAARKLTFAGRLATARSDWDELRVVANMLTKEDLAIIVSMSGETLHIIEYANLLKQHDVPILAIVGRENSRLEKLSTLCIHAYLESYYVEEVDMSSRFPFHLAIDLITLAYLEDKNQR